MITEQELELGKALCFTICYAIFVVSGVCCSVSNLISIYKKNKNK